MFLAKWKMLPMGNNLNINFLPKFFRFFLKTLNYFALDLNIFDPLPTCFSYFCIKKQKCHALKKMQGCKTEDSDKQKQKRG